MKLINVKQKGVTLIEILAVLALAAVVIGAALSKYLDAQTKENVRTETSNLGSIYANTLDMFDGSNTAGTLDNDFAIDSEIFPRSMKQDGGADTVFNKWNGAVEITAVGVVGFAVEYDNVPAGSACIDLIKKQAQTGWDEFSTENGVNALYSNATPVDYKDACLDPGDGQIDDVTFTFN